MHQPAQATLADGTRRPQTRTPSTLWTTVFRQRNATIGAPAMRAERFPYGRHGASCGVAGNSGRSAAGEQAPSCVSTLTTFFFLGRGLVEDSWESVA
jgi:hypothetical protein